MGGIKLQICIPKAESDETFTLIPLSVREEQPSPHRNANIVQPFAGSLTPVTNIDALRARWCALEEKSDAAFFLSWQWIGTWLSGLNTLPYLLAVQSPNGDDIALGLFCRVTETRQKWLKIKQLRLHDTGVRSADAITIEFNSLLTVAGMEHAAWAAALKHLATRSDWDEIIVSGATGEVASFLGKQGLVTHRRAETTSAKVNLADLRGKNISDREGYTATLGKSTRSQIRRSARLYEEHGPLYIEAAETQDQADTFMAELGHHHEAKWQAQGVKGATANADYMAFHNRLIAESLPAGGIEILRARAGDYAFGWLYNFVYRGNVLFYLSGFRAEDDNRLKPGLITHTLAIERHLQGGMDVYDFMGGTNRYKTNLGEPGPDIVSLALQRKTAKLRVENWGRSLKSRLKK